MIFRDFRADILRDDFWNVKADLFFRVVGVKKKSGECFLLHQPTSFCYHCGAFGPARDIENKKMLLNNFQEVVIEDSFFSHWKLILCLCTILKKSSL